MIYDQRVLHQTTDISTLVNDFRAGTYVFPYAVGEYLYIGSTFPFNNLFVEMGTANTVDVLEIQTLTFPTKAAAGASDYIVIYDAMGASWAVALDTTGTDPDPTGAAWLAVSASNRIKVDVSGATTAADVAALAVAGLNSLTGFMAVITLMDNTDGTVSSVQVNYGATTNPVPHNADDSGVGSILGVQTQAGSLGAVLSAEIWFGNQWIPVVDLIDGTNGMSQTGRIMWNTDLDKGWDIEQRSADVTGLSATTIYNMFWMRFSWDEDFISTASVKYIGQKFSDDATLYSYYPDFSKANVKTTFGAGKTDWNEQHYMAAEQIVADLKKRNIAKSRSQLLDYSLFSEASCRKIAEMIYTSFGAPYLDQLKLARESFKNAMDMENFGVDLNNDGRLDPAEKNCYSVGFGTR